MLDAARRRDDGKIVTTEASYYRITSYSPTLRSADRALQINGRAGHMAEYGIERFYLDVRLFRLLKAPVRSSKSSSPAI
ncbi:MULTISPECIES: acyl-CoA dehydrogenase family protein [unclassified Bradyrhizobium]